MVSLLNNRPSATNFFNSTVLQEWTKATNIRFRLLRPKTLLGQWINFARNDFTLTRRVTQNQINFNSIQSNYSFFFFSSFIRCVTSVSEVVACATDTQNPATSPIPTTVTNFCAAVVTTRAELSARNAVPDSSKKPGGNQKPTLHSTANVISYL